MWKSVLVIALAAAVLAGCGGGGSAKLSSGDVAVVGGKHISKTAFDGLLQEAKVSYKEQGRPFPAQGTASYQAIRGEVVALLVQEAERDVKAAKMGIKVSDTAIEQRFKQIARLPQFGGSEKKFKAELQKSHLTVARIRDDVRATLTYDAIYNKVTGGVSVSDQEVHAYYQSHLPQFTEPETRDVRYILVGKSKALAQSVYRQLKGGNAQTWCRLAKKYAKDQSAKTCGKATFTKGETVPVFDNAAFTAPAGKVAAPFYDPTKYKAWFVIEPLGAVKSIVTPEKQVAASIRETLLQGKKNDAMNAWLAGLKKDFCGGSEIKYQVGYSPSPDPCAASPTTNATTTG